MPASEEITKVIRRQTCHSEGAACICHCSLITVVIVIAASLQQSFPSLLRSATSRQTCENYGALIRADRHGFPTCVSRPPWEASEYQPN